jgi:ubiquinone/menaquinone biosynthesis C-methylase UbiE
MINMQKRDWESIYRQRGDLKFRVLSKIVRASRLFETRNYKKILDVGCGTGKHSIYLAKKGFSVYATDISPTGIDIARRKARSLGLTNIHFKQHDMVTIPFVDGFFDAVVCTWAIYHGTLEQIQKTVSEIYRVLKPDGTVVTDFLSVLTESYRSGREIEKNTFIGDKYQEEDVPHHYATREELTQLFSEFRQLKIHLSSKIYIGEQGEKHFSKRYNVQAIK